MTHEVTFSLPTRYLELSDLEVKVKSNNKMFGRLRISKGSLVWIPRHHSVGFKFNWESFNRTAINHGKYGHK